MNFNINTNGSVNTQIFEVYFFPLGTNQNHPFLTVLADVNLNPAPMQDSGLLDANSDWNWFSILISRNN